MVDGGGLEPANTSFVDLCDKSISLPIHNLTARTVTPKDYDRSFFLPLVIRFC